MNLKHRIQQAAGLLIESDSPTLDAELLLLHVLQKNRTLLFTHPDYSLTEEQSHKFDHFIQRRQQGEPVAYIMGHQGFWNLDLEVAPHTLIPRGDTESLVEWILENNQSSPKRILDLGTGTGALALALAQEFPQAEVMGLDVIPEAVELAKRNAARNQITNAQFMQSNWFSAVESQNTKFDLIVSNPPYIDKTDHHLDEGDVRFEPRSALVAEDEGYADLFFIAEQTKSYLNGVLIMEHGWQQAEKVRNFLNQLGYTQVGSGSDLGGNERFTFGWYAKNDL